MDNDRIAGAANDAAGKVESAKGVAAGEATGRVRQASTVAQNLYGQAKDVASTLAKPQVTSRRTRWTPVANTIAKVAAHSPRL